MWLKSPGITTAALDTVPFSATFGKPTLLMHRMILPPDLKESQCHYSHTKGKEEPLVGQERCSRRACASTCTSALVQALLYGSLVAIRGPQDSITSDICLHSHASGPGAKESTVPLLLRLPTLAKPLGSPHARAILARVRCSPPPAPC